MCSVFDFIEKQKYFIETQRKTIESLDEFLNSIDRRVIKTIDTKEELKPQKISFEPKVSSVKQNGEKIRQKSRLLPEPKVSDDLMLNPDHLFGWADSTRFGRRRQHLADERRKDYNEFLEQKSKLDFENQKQKTKRVSNYKELLNKKRSEEQKHRELNGFNEIEDMDMDLNFEQIDKSSEYKVPTVGWFHCSNNKFVPEYITPRSRLLATHSSRLKAAQYREELRKQIEEKNKIKSEESKRIRSEEEELERKLEEQRLRMLREYEEEQKVLHKKAEELRVSEEISKQIPNRDHMIGSTSPLSLLRSPTYMQLREESALSPLSPRKSKTVSRSLASELSQTMRTTQSTATQTSARTSAHYKPDLTSAELSDSEASNSSSSDDELPNEDKSKDDEFRKRVLSRLSEVRQMMESDHIRMMEQLRHQQLQQIES